MPVLTEPVCIVDGHHGIYVPQVWAERFGLQAAQTAGVDPFDVSRLLNGPESDDYWESWDSILNDYCHTVDGVKHHLTQDGDLFEIPETYNEGWEDF